MNVGVPYWSWQGFVHPGSSRSVKMSAFWSVFSGEFRHKFYTEKEDPGRNYPP